MTTTYDAAGRASARTDARGNPNSYDYDAVGRLLRSEDARGAVTSFVYDSVGNRIRETTPLGRSTSSEYDVDGRLTRTTFPDGTSQGTTYDAAGRRIALTDETGTETSFGYDQLGHLSRVTDALGGVTSYAYDEPGNLRTITDARGNSTHFGYDNAGRIVRRTLPLGESETFDHDANGNVTSHTDFNRATTVRTYDSFNRVTNEIRPEGTYSYTYTATGLNESVHAPAGETQYRYDVRDRLVRVNNPDGSWVGYGYDADCNRISLSSAAGTIRYDIDSAGNLSAVTDPSSGVTRYGYDLDNNRTSAQLPDATREIREYDVRDRLIGIRQLRADDAVIGRYAYTLDPAGQRVAVEEDGGRRRRYRYDPLHRLVEEDVAGHAGADGATSYTYDAVGNRLAVATDAVTTHYTYDANDQLHARDTTSYDYDANGNVVRRSDGTDTRRFVYDSTNRLVGANDGTTSTQFRYDWAGNRVGAEQDGVATRYVVDAAAPLARVLDEVAHDGSLSAHYVFGDGLVSQQRGTTTSYYHQDGLGSTRALTDATGVVTDTYEFDAFGNQTESSGTTQNDFRFVGEQRDGSLGDYDLRARRYDPSTGRFTSLDPLLIGDVERPTSLHRYVYADGDPVNRTDPTGLFSLGELSIGISISGILATIALPATAGLVPQTCNALKGPDMSGPGSNPSTGGEGAAAFAAGGYKAALAYSLGGDAVLAAQTSGLPGLPLSQHLGPADAFRHALWNCWMAQRIGAGLAERIATGHENSRPSKIPFDNQMDLHNNAVGRSLAPATDCVSAAKAATASGQLRTIRGPGTNPQALPPVVNWCIGPSDQPWP